VAGQIGIITCDDKDRNPYVVTLEGGMKSDFYSESEIEIVSDKAPDPRATPPAKPLPVGTLVTRGPDWEWGEHDGEPGNVGKVISDDTLHKGWVRVKWSNGYTDSYRMGYDGKFDLKVVSPPIPASFLASLVAYTISFSPMTARFCAYPEPEHIESRSEIRARLLGL